MYQITVIDVFVQREILVPNVRTDKGYSFGESSIMWGKCVCVSLSAEWFRQMCFS